MDKEIFNKKNKIQSEGIHLRLSAASALYQGDGRHRNLINKYLLEGLSRLQKAQPPISIQRASRKRCRPYQELTKPLQRSGAVRGAGVCQCCWALLCTRKSNFLSLLPLNVIQAIRCLQNWLFSHRDILSSVEIQSPHDVLSLKWL